MTRKEEIINQARQKEKECGFSPIVKQAKGVNSAYGIGFLEGCVWADENPDSSWGVRLKLEREEWLDKACDWLINHNDYIKVFGNCMATGFDMARCVEDFRKAMED